MSSGFSSSIRSLDLLNSDGNCQFVSHRSDTSRVIVAKTEVQLLRHISALVLHSFATKYEIIKFIHLDAVDFGGRFVRDQNVLIYYDIDAVTTRDWSMHRRVNSIWLLVRLQQEYALDSCELWNHNCRHQIANSK